MESMAMKTNPSNGVVTTQTTGRDSVDDVTKEDATKCSEKNGTTKNDGKKDEIHEQKTFDDFLQSIGHVGRLQIWIMFAMSVGSFITGYQNMCPVFTLNMPKHRCKLPDYPNDTYEIQSAAHELLINASIPRTSKGGYDNCYIFVHDADFSNSSRRPKMSCDDWVFDQSVFTRTLTTDLHLVCSNKIMRSHSNMLIFAGKFLGAVLQGIASDIFGRRVVWIITALGTVAASVGNGFVTNEGGLLALRFLTGMMTTASYLAIYVIGIEFMAPADRTKITLTTRIFFVFSQMTLTPFAYLIRDWQYLQLAITWPGLILLLIMWFVPESPRWLLSKHKTAEAEKVIQLLGRVNKVKLPDNVTSSLNLEEKRVTLPAYHLFTDIRLAIRWIIIYINWIVIAMVYYGLTLNVSNLSGNIFLNFFISVLVDFISVFATGFVVNKISRKYFHMAAMLVGGCACASTFIPILIGENKVAVITLSMIGKFGISVAFFLIYTYTAELFPTNYRAFGMGTSSMMGRIGGIASPYVADLNTYIGGQFGSVLPQLVFGVSGIIAGLLVIALPDTRGRKLPENLYDAKHFTDSHHIAQEGVKSAVTMEDNRHHNPVVTVSK